MRISKHRMISGNKEAKNVLHQLYTQAYWEIAIRSVVRNQRFPFLRLKRRCDQALSRLVKCGILIRVTRGVFIKESSIMPSAMEVARAKARAFGKEIARHGADLAKELGLTQVVSQVQKFAVNGRSSSFLFRGNQNLLERHQFAQDAIRKWQGWRSN